MLHPTLDIQDLRAFAPNLAVITDRFVDKSPYRIAYKTLTEKHKAIEERKCSSVESLTEIFARIRTKGRKQDRSLQ